MEIETSAIVNTNILSVEREENLEIFANLPKYECIIPYPLTNWHDFSGKEFVKKIDNIYNEITQWRKNLFKLPTGKAAKAFIIELTTWLEHFNKNSQFQCIALKVYMILPCLLLQKPSKNSKARDHIRKLEERLKAWNEGRIHDLLQEGRTIQKRIKT